MKDITKIYPVIFIIVVIICAYALYNINVSINEEKKQEQLKIEQKAQQEEQEKQERLNKIITLLDNEKLTQAELKTILDEIKSFKPNDGSNLKVLQNYSQSRYEEMITDEPLLKDRYAAAVYYANLIPDNYNGVLKDKILAYKKYIIQKNKNAIDEFNRLANEIGVTLNIGDPEQAVIDAYGQPIRINTTETAEGTKKQYVYPNNHYVYVTNGKVTAIQH